MPPYVNCIITVGVPCLHFGMQVAALHLNFAITVSAPS